MLMTPAGRIAKLHYGANGFRILVHGDHVMCAKTGALIALEHLRYWSVAKQEPYASAETATKAAVAK